MLTNRLTARGEVVLKQLVVDEQWSVGVCEEEEDFLVWSGCYTCWWFGDIGIEPAERFDAPLRGAGVFNASPAACAWGASEGYWWHVGVDGIVS